MCRWAENGPKIVPKPFQDSGRDEAPKSEQQQRALGASGAAVETVAKRPRRVFTAAEKLRIVKEAERCLATGERGALEAMLRREGVYSSLLALWRAKLDARGATGLAAEKPGRKPELTDADRRIAELEKRSAELERKLHVATALISLQKKAHEILGLVLPESEGDG